MKVQITITGLCLLIPDAGKVHVFMPRTDGSSGSNVHPHDPTLHYLGIHNNAVDMRNYNLDLGALGTGTKMPGLDHLLDISDMTAGTFDPQKPVCRITLPLVDGGYASRTAKWELMLASGDKVERKLTHQLTWFIDKPQLGSVIWKRTPRGGGAAKEIGAPVPDGNGVIHISITHLPRIRERLRPGDESHHPQAYYDLFGKKGKNPILKETPSWADAEEWGFGPHPAESAFNCILGKG